MIKTGYKLVQRSDYGSIMAEGKYTLHYLPGTIVTALPGTLGVMFFDSIQHLLDFLDWDMRRLTAFAYRIIEVQYDTDHTHPHVKISYLWPESCYDAFYATEYSAFDTYVIPLGTVFCDSVNCKQEILLCPT